MIQASDQNAKVRRSAMRSLIAFAVSSVLWNGIAGASAPMSLKERELIEANFNSCLRTQLSNTDIKQIRDFRERLYREVPAFKIQRGENYEAAITSYMAALSRILPLEINAKVQPRLLMVIAERTIWQQVSETLSVDNKAFRHYMRLARASMDEQRPVDADELKRAHQNLANELVNYDLNRTDAALGLKVPTAVAMTQPERLGALAFALNMMTETALSIQVDNARVANDKWAYKKALAAQIGVSVIGTGAFISTFLYGGALVQGSASLASMVGAKVLVGQAGGALSVGVLGSSGWASATESVLTMGSAYVKSSVYGTPFRCEFDRENSLNHLKSAFLHGVGMGAAAGLGATLGAHLQLTSRALILTTAGLIVGGMTYEAVYATYDVLAMVELNKLAKELENLKDVPESQKYIQAALVKAVWAEYLLHAKSAMRHGMQLTAIASLFYYWFPHGELRHALQEGIERAKLVMAPSADTIPSVLMSAQELAATGYSGAKGIIMPAAVPLPTVMSQARSFISKITFGPKAGVASGEATGWQIVGSK